MKKYLFMICLGCAFSAYADPFYSGNAPQEGLEKQENKNNISLNCLLITEINQINIPTLFEQLTLIGVVKIDDKLSALFLDKENNLVDLHQNDYLIESKIQVLEIDLKHIIYLDWNKTVECDKPYQIEQKL